MYRRVSTLWTWRLSGITGATRGLFIIVRLHLFEFTSTFFWWVLTANRSRRSISLNALPTAFAHRSQSGDPVRMGLHQHRALPPVLLCFEVENAEGEAEEPITVL